MGCSYKTVGQQNEFGIFIEQQNTFKSRKSCSCGSCNSECYNNLKHNNGNEETRQRLVANKKDNIVKTQSTQLSQQQKVQTIGCTKKQIVCKNHLSKNILVLNDKSIYSDIDCFPNVSQPIQTTSTSISTPTPTRPSATSATSITSNRKSCQNDKNCYRKITPTARAIASSIAISYINSCLRALQNASCSSLLKLHSFSNNLYVGTNTLKRLNRQHSTTKTCSPPYSQTSNSNEYRHYQNICCQRPTPHYNHGSHYHIASPGDGNNTEQYNSTHAYTSAAALHYLGYNNYNVLRNSINFYAASSVILVLCYLTTTTTAATTNSETSQLDKHPIKGIDWSKFDETSSDKEILDLLLEKKRYDKRLLPPVNDEDFCCGLSSPDMAKIHNARRLHKRGTLTVNVNVLLLSLASPDESSLKYEVEFLLNQQWTDPRLQYGNKSHYDFLNALHHHDSIWTPDTYFIMHGDFKDPIIPMHFALRIYRNGTITYAMRRHLILSCQGSLHIFPFDDPKCSFSMESISYEEAQIKYVWKNDEDTLRKSPSLTTLNAYLIKNQTTPCDQNSWRGNYSCLRVDLIFTRDRAFYFTTVFIPGIILVTSSFITFWLEWNAVPARSMIGNYSCLQVELTFTRDRAYYFTTVFIPGIILVTSSFITFWLEWNAVPARVMIGVTTMLNFFTTSNGFRSTLPVVSNLTAMNVWDGVCMCFIYASLLEFVCVNYFGRKTPKRDAVYRPGENVVTQHLPAVLSRIGVILASPLGIIEREFHAAVTSEKPIHDMGHTKQTKTHGTRHDLEQSKVPDEIYESIGMPLDVVGVPKTKNIGPLDEYELVTSSDSLKFGESRMATGEEGTSSLVRRLKSISTNTPPLIVRGESVHVDIHQQPETIPQAIQQASFECATDEEVNKLKQILPLKPPRSKTSRSSSPCKILEIKDVKQEKEKSLERNADGNQDGEKRRDGVSSEIVACTICGGLGSPCTHSAKNGCATETCFVQVRKREPHHPIRVAKTIDVIARITFPTAYAIFLIFFFVHYKGFS